MKRLYHLDYCCCNFYPAKAFLILLSRCAFHPLNKIVNLYISVVYIHISWCWPGNWETISSERSLPSSRTNIRWRECNHTSCPYAWWKQERSTISKVGHVAGNMVVSEAYYGPLNINIRHGHVMPSNVSHVLSYPFVFTQFCALLCSVFLTSLMSAKGSNLEVTDW